MNVDSVRDYCLSFPQAKETLQWGETLCFKVAGKIFALLDLASVPPSLCFKCTPESFAQLCEQEGIRPARYVGRYKWVSLERLDVLSDEEMEDLIRESYDMIVRKISKGKANVKMKGRQVKKVKVHVNGSNHRGHKGHEGKRLAGRSSQLRADSESH